MHALPAALQHLDLALTQAPIRCKLPRSKALGSGGEDNLPPPLVKVLGNPLLDVRHVVLLYDCGALLGSNLWLALNEGDWHNWGGCALNGLIAKAGETSLTDMARSVLFNSKSGSQKGKYFVQVWSI